jgi:citrate lyase beta subunit
MRKSALLDCDGVILDLEDAVAPAKKGENWLVELDPVKSSQQNGHLDTSCCS